VTHVEIGEFNQGSGGGDFRGFGFGVITRVPPFGPTNITVPSGRLIIRPPFGSNVTSGVARG